MPSLPTIDSLQGLLPALKVWQQKLRPVISVPAAPRTPFRFSASSPSAATGISLSWGIVPNADGYILYRSDNGNFQNATVIAKITHVQQTSYFDNLGVASVTKYYRIASTAGTPSQRQSVTGKQSATISATSGSGTTSYDQASGSSGSGGWNRPGGDHQGGRNTQ